MANTIYPIIEAQINSQIELKESYISMWYKFVYVIIGCGCEKKRIRYVGILITNFISVKLTQSQNKTVQTLQLHIIWILIFFSSNFSSSTSTAIFCCMETLLNYSTNMSCFCTLDIQHVLISFSCALCPLSTNTQANSNSIFSWKYLVYIFSFYCILFYELFFVLLVIPHCFLSLSFFSFQISPGKD